MATTDLSVQPLPLNTLVGVMKELAELNRLLAKAEQTNERKDAIRLINDATKLREEIFGSRGNSCRL